MSEARRPKQPEVVVDTNLFVSGTILKRGLPFTLLEAWRKQSFILLLSEDQLLELDDVLNRPEIVDKYFLSEDERRDLFSLLATLTKPVRPVVTLPVRVRDINDEKILAAAIGGKADYLITGDDDLLVLRDDPQIGSLKIVRPGSSWISSPGGPPARHASFVLSPLVTTQ